MKAKYIIAAVLLITIGIVFGVVLVSSFKGVDLGFAQELPKLGAQSPPLKTDVTLENLNKAFESVGRKVTPSVVYINVKSSPKDVDTEGRQDGGNYFYHFFMPRRPEPEIGAGSGVIITSDGYILTNNHVIENADEGGIKVILSDTREFKAKLIGSDKTTDLAVIKIEANYLTPPYLGNSEEVEVGHIVFAFGNPLGLQSTMTMGIVSAVGRQIYIIGDNRTGLAIENFIQTDAAINPGNSGGALVNVNGEVIGINTAIATTNARYQGYGFAIPINLAKSVAADIIRFGKVRRGYIGVRIQTIDATLAKSLGLEKPKGVLIQEVNQGSGGEEAGLNAGDVIFSIDGKEVNTSNQLQSIVASKHPGDYVVLKIYRDRKTLEVKVRLKPRADEDETVVASEKKESEKESAKREKAEPVRVKFDKLGFSVRMLDEKTKKNYNVANGVVVESVDPYGEASARALQQNDVILSVSDVQITSVKQIEKIINELKAGDAILLRVKRTDKTLVFIALEMPR